MAVDVARDVALDAVLGSNYRILVRNTQTSAVCGGPADVAVRVAARVGGCEGGSPVRQAPAQVVLAEGALAQGVFTRAVFTRGAFTQQRIFPDAFAWNIFNDSSAAIFFGHNFLRPQFFGHNSSAANEKGPAHSPGLDQFGCGGRI
ncbi:hypothetical protein ABE612_03350 [Achromobacter xylosoxidans]|uniref:hypothetical protein n=1 Tax=Alcaligenes xylosoxydans xylosoxydans TaxID=85698 RepID=UPI00320B3E7C